MKDTLLVYRKDSAILWSEWNVNSSLAKGTVAIYKGNWVLKKGKYPNLLGKLG